MRALVVDVHGSMRCSAPHHASIPYKPNPNSVKEVNQGLCDDGLVDTEKIGAGNFFWCMRLC